MYIAQSTLVYFDDTLNAQVHFGGVDPPSQTIYAYNPYAFPSMLTGIAISGVNAADFTVGTTVGCTLTGPTLGVTVNPARQCALPITYTNTTGATESATLTVSFAAGAEQTVALSGAAQAVVATATSLQPDRMTAPYGSSIQFTATVAAVSGTAVPVGKVQFEVDGAAAGSPVPLGNTGIAIYQAASLQGGPHSVMAVYVPSTIDFTASSSPAFSVTITPAVTTVTWAAPAPIIYGTPLSATQLNATASVPGTFTYTPAAGTILGAGGTSLMVLFTPQYPNNYATSMGTASLVVNQYNPAVAVTSSVTKAPYGTDVKVTVTVTGVNGFPPTGIVSIHGFGGSSGNVYAPTSFGSGSATYVYDAGVLQAGTYTVSASFDGSANYATASTNVAAEPVVTITPVALTVTAADATRVYGTANPAFSGTYAGAVNGDLFHVAASSSAVTLSNAGTYSIVPEISGDNLASYTVSYLDGTLTITKAKVNGTIVITPDSAPVGSTITFTTRVTSTTSGVPTGSMYLICPNCEPGYTIEVGPGTLSNGSLTLTATVPPTNQTPPNPLYSLPFVLNYDGDENFEASPFAGNFSTAQTLKLFDFSLASSLPSPTIPSGQSATATITAAALAGENVTQPIAFTVSGLPAGYSASFSPASVTPGTGSATSTLTISPLAQASNTKPAFGRSLGGRNGQLFAAFLLPMAALWRSRRRLNRYVVSVTVIAISLAAMASLVACGNPPSPQTIKITVTGTVGVLQHTTSFTLNVQ